MEFEKELKKLLEKHKMKIGEVSDGYHTFDELYEHRHNLFIALSKSRQEIHENDLDSHPSIFDDDDFTCVRSKIHEDGLDVWNEWGMFILCITSISKKQISYHLPKEYWDDCNFAETQLKARKPWDGHTSKDVLIRLTEL